MKRICDKIKGVRRVSSYTWAWGTSGSSATDTIIMLARVRTIVKLLILVFITGKILLIGR